MSSLKPLPYPSRIEASYRVALRGYVQDMQRGVVQALTLDPRWRQDDMADDMAEIMRTLRARFRGLWPESRIRDLALKMFEKLNMHNVRAFRRQWDKGLRTVTPLDDVGLQSAFVRENVALIQSIDTRYHTEVERLVMDAIRTGRRVEGLREDLRARYGVSRSRAALIARDQVGKVVGQMTRKRQQNAGVEQAKWSTSRDERVRKTHREVEGEVYDLDGEGLLVGGKYLFPGQDYQCRCSSIPVIPDFDAPVD